MFTQQLLSRIGAGVAAMCLFLGKGAAAQPVLIDFETLAGAPFDSAPCPLPMESRLSDQFLSSYGVRFSSGSPYVAVVNLGFGHATSGVNGIGGTTPDGCLTYDGTFRIVATFFDPANPTTPAWTDFVSLRTDNWGSGLGVSLHAFDINNQLIGSATAPDNGGDILQIAVPGIHSVQYIGTISSAGAPVDDFMFNPVPEPSALALLAVGAAVGLAIRRRKPQRGGP